MATGRPETIDAASVRTEAQRRMPGGQLSCLARNGGGPGSPRGSPRGVGSARGRKLNAGIAASRTRRSRCPARSGHYRDPNGRAARNIDNARRSKRTSPRQDHADGNVEILLSNSRRRPAPRRRAAMRRPAIAHFGRPEPGAPLPKAAQRTRISGEVTLDESELPPCSDQNSARTGWRCARLIRSRRCRAYDSAGVPSPPGPSGGAAASRAQAVAPITAAPMTAKTCRQTSDVMVRQERPNVA